MFEKISFATEDEVKIIGDYYAVRNPQATAVLLHMMPADKSSWRELSEILQTNKIQSLAIDFRGHGESLEKNGKTLNYKNFSDKKHQESIKDIEAAAEFILNKGIIKEKIILIGASIGANLALEYLSEHSEIPLAVLLSPGLNYRGIKTDKFIKNIYANQKILILASEEDIYSTDSAKQLKNLAPENTEVKIYNNLGHGTTMFEKNPELINEILEWIKNKFTVKNY